LEKESDMQKREIELLKNIILSIKGKIEYHQGKTKREDQRSE
jgi:hypothetical protein